MLEKAFLFACVQIFGAESAPHLQIIRQALGKASDRVGGVHVWRRHLETFFPHRLFRLELAAHFSRLPAGERVAVQISRPVYERCHTAHLGRRHVPSQWLWEPVDETGSRVATLQPLSFGSLQQALSPVIARGVHSLVLLHPDRLITDHGLIPRLLFRQLTKRATELTAIRLLFDNGLHAIKVTLVQGPYLCAQVRVTVAVTIRRLVRLMSGRE